MIFAKDFFLTAKGRAAIIEPDQKGQHMDLESSSSTPPASADLTSSALEHQRDYFYAGKTLSWESRKAALKALKAAVQAHEDQVLKALAADLGKPAFEAFST